MVMGEAVVSGQSAVVEEAPASSKPAAADATPTAHCLLPIVHTALDSVTDPELPFLTIRDLGILREVRETPEGPIEVVITPTYSGCPANDIIALDIMTALAKAGIADARITLVRAPAWTTDWITPEAREKLSANGIAPPPPASGKRALFSAEPLACPRCGSAYTEQVSAFGSTACKAQHRCLDCREPFEAFKCI
jgi:ring-1,2-phenylacetyl-CoA epoxidase subunit PaaD